MASTTALPPAQTFFSFGTLSMRWSVSKDTLRRKADADELKTIYLAGRRMIPLSEVLRVEKEGLGSGRKRPVRQKAENETQPLRSKGKQKAR
jgi:hypothetical protein